MNCVARVACFAAVVCVSSTVPALAQQKAEGIQPLRISINHVASLNQQAAVAYTYLDNAHLYAEAVRQVTQYAEAMVGAELVWQVRVLKVTETEVIYDVYPAAGTVIGILPDPNSVEWDSVERTHRIYPGPRSTQLGNILSRPKTLRIGKAISLDVARQLRHGDVIGVIGRVAYVQPPRFNNSLYDNIVYIADVKFYVAPQY